MIYNYPSIVVENFFKYPQDVREMALEMEYYPSDIGTYSGVRTKSLHITHPNFFREVCNKILDCYSINYLDYTSFMHFHLTGEEHGESGWVHCDAYKETGSSLASIVYLNTTNNDLNNGTTLYKLSNLDMYQRGNIDMKKAFITSIDNKEAKIKHNNNFTPTVRIGNMYNRMVAYDARNPHSGMGYYGNDKETSRLTLLTFFNKIITEDTLTPLQRANTYSTV